MPLLTTLGSKHLDPISRYLGEVTQTVQIESTLRHAANLMAAAGTPHLPVLHNERVAGLLRESDLHLIERFSELAFETTTVAAVMCCDLNLTLPSATLGSVLRSMRRGHYDHAIVLDRSRLYGVFSATDALRLFEANLLVTPAPRADEPSRAERSVQVGARWARTVASRAPLRRAR